MKNMTDLLKRVFAPLLIVVLATAACAGPVLDDGQDGDDGEDVVIVVEDGQDGEDGDDVVVEVEEEVPGDGDFPGNDVLVEDDGNDFDGTTYYQLEVSVN